jgi:hypothetical protein
MTEFSRRRLLVSASAVGVFAATTPMFARRASARQTAAGSPASAAAGEVMPHFPSQDPDLVREVVGKSHSDLDAVIKLVERRPELAKAAVDHGFGDWETALGAASHTGQREIAHVLMKHGARPDLFTFAMLGNVDVVRAALAADPALATLKGPHGIPLLNHARAGGDEAKLVVEFLETVSGAGTPDPSLPLADPEGQTFAGVFEFGTGPRDRVEVTFAKGRLEVRRIGGSPRRLVRVHETEFFPVGAPSIRLRFAMDSGRAVALTFHDPEPYVTATRIA